MKSTTPPPRCFPSRSAFRAWLQKNHGRDQGLWVVLSKKHIKKGLHYEEAAEEALCFGWIDGQLRRIDDNRHMLRFTPRRKGSVWAPSNIARVKRLVKQKKMTRAGLAVFRSAKLSKHAAPTVATKKRIVLPSDLRAALVANTKSWMHFQNYPKSFRLLTIAWVLGAKKQDTRERRITNVVRNAAKHARPQY